MRKSVFLLSLFVLPLYMLLQAQEKTAPFWGKQEVYLMNQTEKTFHLVDALLKENPPSSGNPALARKAALQLLDVYSMIRVWMVVKRFRSLWNLV